MYKNDIVLLKKEPIKIRGSEYLLEKTKNDIALIKGDVKVSLEDIGEGWNGDYNPNDPDDQKLFRFSVWKSDGDPDFWTEVDGASYCTRLEVGVAEPDLIVALKFLMDKFYTPVMAEQSIRILAQQMSWLDQETIDDLKLNKRSDLHG
jgi:hypothetical protein